MGPNQQAKIEMEIFKKFAGVCPYAIDLNSIEKREPPEPDLICNLSNGTPIAFELVEIIAQNYIRNLYRAIDIKKELDKHYEALPPKEKKKFKRDFGNARILIFPKAVSETKLRSAIPLIFKFLETLGPQAEGRYNLHSDKKLGKVVKCIRIKRGVAGPIFRVGGAATWFKEPAPKRLKEKLCKDYKTHCQAELIGYYQLQPILPEDHWLPLVEEFEEFVEANLSTSIFERVWIYSVGQDKILYVYPPLDTDRNKD